MVFLCTVHFLLPQILCLTEQILFTKRCEEAITTNSLGEYLVELEDQLGAYTSTELKEGNLSKEDAAVLELKLKALILDCVHFIDVVRQLIDSQTRSTSAWQWSKQLRSAILSTHLPTYVHTHVHVRTSSYIYTHPTSFAAVLKVLSERGRV